MLKFEQNLFKKWAKEKIGETIDRMGIKECLQFLRPEKYAIIPVSFADKIKESSFEEIKIIGEVAMEDEETFQFFLDALPVEQKIRFLEQQYKSIALKNADIVA